MMSLEQCLVVRNPATILIVDDTPTNIHILAMALKNHYSLRMATSGQVALEILQRPEKPDLILLDVMMPGMDGFEVCRRIKQDPTSKNIPVIFVSAKDEVQEQQRGFDLGAVDYIPKPFEIPLLLARINVHIRLKLMTERLEKLAMVDGLTDIPNRRSFEETLTRECGRAQREGVPFAVLMIDVDHFKAFNDHYGHGVGDQCLRRVASALAAHHGRPGDFVGRYGGEEFVVILPNCDEAGAFVVAEKLRAAIASLGIPHVESSAANHVTISVGVSLRSEVAIDACQSMVHDADQALYAAKSQGRNRVATTLGVHP